MSDWELFIDESGTFDEMRPEGGSSDGRRFPSLLAGVVARRGDFTEARAEAILRRCFDGAHPEVIHSTELQQGELGVFRRLGDALSKAADLRAVRLVNREGLDFGGRVATYTNMLAELCVRVFEDLARGVEGDVRLRVHYARWMVDNVQVPPEEYRSRLVERLAFALVRRGRADRSADWKLGEVRSYSARKDRRGQICDLLCNGSHDDFRRCDDASRAALERAFAHRDYAWTVRALTERVGELESAGAIGYALREIAAVLDELEGEARAQAESQLAGLVKHLAELDSTARTTQLDALVNWLRQLAEHRGDLRLGLRACDECLERVIAPLAAVRDPHLDAAHFTFERLALTASNHLGDVVRAHRASEVMKSLYPALAGRWDHAPTLLEGMIHQAVHLIDTLRPDEAARLMKSVAGFYETLGSLFEAALPDVFPEKVRSDLRGQALGTWLQAEMYAGLTDPSRFELARALSDKAMEEFAAESDRARQAQYRAQLETYARDWPTARHWLGRSLRVDDEPTHERLAATVVAQEGFPQGFALLHWSRIGAHAAIAGASDEAAAFVTALRSVKLLGSSWLTADAHDYPAHGIRRFVAIVQAHTGDTDGARSTLGKLRALEPDPGEHPIMDLTILAAHAEVAAMLARDPDAARHLILGKKAHLPDRVRRVRRKIPDSLGVLAELLDAMATIRTIEPEQLLALARRVAD